MFNLHKFDYFTSVFFFKILIDVIVLKNN